MGEQVDIPESQALVVTRKWWQSPWFRLLLLGIVLYVLVYWYQSDTLVQNVNYQHRTMVDLFDGMDVLTLDVLYPQTLRLDATSASSQTVAVALWYARPPTRTRRYTVTFTVPITPVIMTARTSDRITPRFVITPAIGEATPVTFYIQQVPLSEVGQTQITPTVEVQSPYGTSLEIPQVFRPITLERRSSAHWRQFWSLIFAPTTPILVGAASLVALAVEEIRHWTRQAQEQRRVAALAKIRSLASLLTTDLSEAARRYAVYQRQADVIWKDKYLQGQLREVWHRAPERLRHTVEILGDRVDTNREHFYNTVKRVGPERSARALEWAYERLDDDWRRRAWDGFVLLSQHPEYRESVNSEVLLDVEHGAWRAILQVWPHLSLWRKFPSAFGTDIAKGLHFLRLTDNPFGSEQAEADTLLLDCCIGLPVLRELHAPRPMLIAGAPGSGKTATALLLAYEGLRDRDAFPIYYPVTWGEASLLPSLQLDKIAQVYVRTLLGYLASTPRAFLEQKGACKAAIAHLLARYIGNDTYLALRLHQAGLPHMGDGARILREIESLIQGGSFQKPLADDELLVLLGAACPYGFRYMMLLLDVQERASVGEVVSSDACLRRLIGLIDILARIGIFVKAFLPDVTLDRLGGQLSVKPLLLEWSDSDLLGLLERRLTRLGIDSLAAWCDPEARALSPDSWLVSAAQGTPGGLIRKGNELLRCIGQNHRHLTAQDLDDILGSLPA